MQGPNGGTCVACNPGYNKSSSGPSNCTLCPANTFTSSSASTICTGNKVCPFGQYPNAAYSASADYVCIACIPNSFCQSNTITQCPTYGGVATISTASSGSFLSCYCPPGTFGNVTSPTVSSCATCPTGSFCTASQCQC